jgi:hypothetical protein
MDMQAFLKQLDAAVDVANRHQAELLAYPGVVTVGAGAERKKGVLTGQAAIVVTVRRKLGPAALKSSGATGLPDQIENVRVDVIELGKPVEAPKILKAQEKTKRVLEKVRDQWLATPNITGIGIGYKTVKGQMNTTQIALKLFVDEKLPPATLKKRGLEEIPPQIDGVVTDVEEMRRQKPMAGSGSRADVKDPLLGGISVGVGSKPFWRGTLGAVVFDQADGRELILSNQHVLDAPEGTDVIQPAPVQLDDSLEVGFQLNVCSPLHFIRLDTPNTTLGTILAGGAAAAALAAALSDEIDPTRRGQQATIPPKGAKTFAESHDVKLDYLDMPVPGTPFRVNSAWRYTRHTDKGDKSHEVDELKQNPHVLIDKLLLTDRKLYRSGDTIRLLGMILPRSCLPRASKGERKGPLTDAEIADRQHFEALDPSINLDLAPRRVRAKGTPASAAVSVAAATSSKVCRCDRYHCVAILTPTRVDRAFPVVLKEPVAAQRADIMNEILTLIRKLDDQAMVGRLYRFLRYGCLRYGTLKVGDIPVGPWNHYLYVQTVNIAPTGMDPLLAAQIIGGLPVSQNAKPVVDVACGPFVFEDGSFDIELIG